MKANSKRRHWIVISNSAEAKFYCKCKHKRPVKISEMHNDSAHLREQQLTSDRPGRMPDPHGFGPHILDQRTTHRDSQAIYFARRIANHLETAQIGNRYDCLTIVAPPSLLGVLRRYFGAGTRKLIQQEIAKDLIGVSDSQLQRFLNNLVSPKWRTLGRIGK